VDRDRFVYIPRRGNSIEVWPESKIDMEKRLRRRLHSKRDTSTSDISQ